MEFFHIFSLVLEVAVAILGVLLWIQKRKPAGGFIFLTFSIYVFYDMARFWETGVNETVMMVLFSVASLSAFVAVWIIYKGDR